MRNIKKSCIILFFAVAVCAFILCCSCQKKEPAASPDPKEISDKISENSDLPDDFMGKIYNSDDKAQNLDEEKATELYSEDNKKVIDISKAEKYFIRLGTENSANEIGIFKLYDTAAAEYVKNMAEARISSVQNKFNETMQESEATVANSGEVREYGNYIYYVMHKDKDKIFKAVEDMLQNES